MDFSPLFLSNVIESVMQPIAREIRYFYNYESNIRSLENESQKLENIRSWVMQRAEDARRNLQVISPNVEAWLTSVNTTTADVAALMQRRTIEVERGCFNGWCPNFKSRYLLSRRAKRIALEVIKLRNEGNKYDVFCYPAAPAVEIETIPSNSIEEFDFRKLKEEELRCLQVTLNLKPESEVSDEARQQAALAHSGLLPRAVISQQQNPPLQPPGTQNQRPSMPYFNIPPMPQQDRPYYPSMDPQRMGAVVASQDGASSLTTGSVPGENKSGSENQQVQRYAYPPGGPPAQGQFYPPYYPPCGYMPPPPPPYQQYPPPPYQATGPPPPGGQQAAHQHNPQPAAAQQP